MNISTITEENTILFKEISSINDVIQMNKYLLIHHTDESVRYITSELVHNAIKTNSSCDVLVNCSKVETLINGKVDKYKEVESYLKNINDSKIIKSKKIGGKGILSILAMGWEIMVEQLSPSKYRVSAINRTN
jgi:hypothetical protein